MHAIFIFLLVNGGALFFWLLKFGKTKFSDEASGRFDHDFKWFRNLVTGILLLFILIWIINKLL
jgi:hypothetical protein